MTNQCAKSPEARRLFDALRNFDAAEAAASLRAELARWEAWAGMSTEEMRRRVASGELEESEKHLHWLMVHNRLMRLERR